MKKKKLPKKAKKPKITPKEYFQFALVMTLMLASIILFVRYLNLKKIEQINEINRDYSLTRGIITETGYRKGRYVEVKFKVDGIFYEGREYAVNSYGKEEGDSITIKFSNKNPEHFITEFHLKY
ncbi:hypothetical protein [uncultured Chryseobacterium sp.]|uniref:hypothetical protein n=1 Tax=uncultured Chryseobacterium sp. TaxID=259322 RepID=UPI0025F0C8BF|nr:hypothetical protein [uncultured Chryseobacterium sp.]